MSSLTKGFGLGMAGGGGLLAALILFTTMQQWLFHPKMSADDLDEDFMAISVALLNEWVEQGQLPEQLTDIPNLTSGLHYDDWLYQRREGFLDFSLSIGDLESHGWNLHADRSLLWILNDEKVRQSLPAEFAEIQEQGEKFARTLIGFQGKGNEFPLEKVIEIAKAGWTVKAQQPEESGLEHTRVVISPTKVPGDDGKPYLELYFPPPEAEVD